MGLKFRKSFKVAPGVRLNVGKKGVGVSVGGKGFRVSSSSRGTTISSGIPGTGISYSKHISSRTKRPQRTRYENIMAQQAKLQQQQEDRVRVEQYLAHVEMLTSMHEEVTDKMDWDKLALSNPPFQYGEEDGPYTLEIKKQINDYKPTWRDRFFNRVEARKSQLFEQLDRALEEDKSLYISWQNERENAQKVLNNDFETWYSVITEANPFADIRDLGSSISFKFENPSKVITKLDINNRSVVPTTVLSLTKTGKLSEKNMAKGKYLQLYQDYVCSCTLRIAREFINLLPVNEVIINVYDEAPAESLEEYGCILSVLFQRKKIESFNFSNIDCSDTIEQFEHNMKFLKTKGFKIVEELKI